MSLVTTPARALPTCTQCGSSRVTSLTMTLTDGSLVDFSSCHRCEHKRWEQGGVELDVATVLGKAHKAPVARQAGPKQAGPKQAGPKQAGPKQAGPKQAAGRAMAGAGS